MNHAKVLENVENFLVEKHQKFNAVKRPNLNGQAGPWPQVLVNIQPGTRGWVNGPRTGSSEGRLGEWPEDRV